MNIIGLLQIPEVRRTRLSTEFDNQRRVIVEWGDKLLNKTVDRDSYQLWVNDTPPNAVIKYL